MWASTPREKSPVPGPRVHHRFTSEWAAEEGLTPSDAEVVGEADIQVDLLWPGSRRWGRHFNPMATLVFGPLYYRRAVRAASGDGSASESLVALGRCLHCLQDGIGHGFLGLAHVKLTLGLTDRNPDEWNTMPPKTRTAIERSTRATVRRYIADTGYASRPSRI
jgi:hypothetical protein